MDEIFIFKLKKHNQKYIILGKNNLKVVDTKFLFLCDKQDNIISYCHPIDFGIVNLCNVDNKFKRDCGMTVRAFDKKYYEREESIFLISVTNRFKLRRSNVLSKKVRGSRKATKEEKEKLYYLIVSEMLDYEKIKFCDIMYGCNEKLNKAYAKCMEWDIIGAYFKYTTKEFDE